MKGRRLAIFFVGQVQAYQSLAWLDLFPTLDTSDRIKDTEKEIEIL